MSCNSQLRPDGRDILARSTKGHNSLWFVCNVDAFCTSCVFFFSLGHSWPAAASSFFTLRVDGCQIATPSRTESIFHPCQLCSLRCKCLPDTRVSRNWTTARVRAGTGCSTLVRGGVNGFYPDNNCPFTTVPKNIQMHLQPPWHLITRIYCIIGSFFFQQKHNIEKYFTEYNLEFFIGLHLLKWVCEVCRGVATWVC